MQLFGILLKGYFKTADSTPKKVKTAFKVRKYIWKISSVGFIQWV